MELKHIKELMAVMSRTGTKRLKLKEGEFELVLERPDHSNGHFVESQQEFSREGHPHHLPRADHSFYRASELPPSNMIAKESKKEDTNSAFITSPMVGTFYSAQSPTDPPFIKSGDRVEKNTVVCIIEAMKVMNEIKANVSGIVAEVLVEAGQPVEFGAKLFRIVEST